MSDLRGFAPWKRQQGQITRNVRALKEAKIAEQEYKDAIAEREAHHSFWDTFEKGIDILSVVTGLPLNLAYDAVDLVGITDIGYDPAMVSQGSFSNFDRIYNEGLRDFDEKADAFDIGDLIGDIATSFYFGGGGEAMKGGGGFEELFDWENYVKSIEGNTQITQSMMANPDQFLPPEGLDQTVYGNALQKAQGFDPTTIYGTTGTGRIPYEAPSPVSNIPNVEMGDVVQMESLNPSEILQDITDNLLFDDYGFDYGEISPLDPQFEDVMERDMPWYNLLYGN